MVGIVVARGFHGGTVMAVGWPMPSSSSIAQLKSDMHMSWVTSTYVFFLELSFKKVFLGSSVS